MSAAPTWMGWPPQVDEVGAVDSVFTRTGDVIAVAGDYNTDLITNLSGVGGATDSAALDTLNAQDGALAAAITGLDSDDIANVSGVAGTSVSDALDTLEAAIVTPFTPASYRGHMLGGEGTATSWTATADYTAVIDAGSPITNAKWVDDTEVGITRGTTSTFTFVAAGTYQIYIRLPINGNARYVSLRLSGDVGGTLWEGIDYYDADQSGGGTRPILTEITVAAGENVTIQYCTANGAASGFGAPPAVSSGNVATSLGNIVMRRVE